MRLPRKVPLLATVLSSIWSPDKAPWLPVRPSRRHATRSHSLVVPYRAYQRLFARREISEEGELRPTEAVTTAHRRLDRLSAWPELRAQRSHGDIEHVVVDVRAPPDFSQEERAG